MTNKLFIGGATGYTGRRVIEQLKAAGAAAPVSWMRTGSRSAAPGYGAVVSATNAEVDKLAAAMQGCGAVLQMIGTTRAQFDEHTSYESVDIGTTEALVRAAERAGVPRFVLLSSIGAGKPMGAYLKAKARAEALVTGSKLNYVIVRPSFILGPGRSAPRALVPVAKALKALPGVGGLGESVHGIEVEDLARLMIYGASAPLNGKSVLWEGAMLWQALKESVQN